MSKIAIAILTYNRVGALNTMLTGLREHCESHQLAVFEDCGHRDTTEKFLTDGLSGTYNKDYLADEYKHGNESYFLGTVNLGVAKNSNRAIKWFMERTDAEHLMLCNDDLLVKGDFAQFYATASKDLGIEMLSFCPMLGPSYRWIEVKKRGYTVKICPRMTGAMLCLSRKLITKIGGFDARFTQFGEEHSDYNNRARFAGGCNLDGNPQPQLDVLTDKLEYQNVETSVYGNDRTTADREASQALQVAAKDYRNRTLYRPFSLYEPSFIGLSTNSGIPFSAVRNVYTSVVDLIPAKLSKYFCDPKPSSPT